MPQNISFVFYKVQYATKQTSKPHFSRPGTEPNPLKISGILWFKRANTRKPTHVNRNLRWLHARLQGEVRSEEPGSHKSVGLPHEARNHDYGLEGQRKEQERVLREGVLDRTYFKRHLEYPGCRFP